MRSLKFWSMILPLCLAGAFAAPSGAPPGPAGITSRRCEAVQAADRPITVGDLRFRIVRIAFDTTATGFVPEDMGPKDLLMFVECELLSGRRDEFKALAIALDKGSGRRSGAAALFSDGMMKALTALTVKSSSYGYRPADSSVAWAFVVQEDERDFSLVFPAGIVVDLRPWIKDRRLTRP